MIMKFNVTVRKRRDLKEQRNDDHTLTSIPTISTYIGEERRKNVKANEMNYIISRRSQILQLDVTK